MHIFLYCNERINYNRSANHVYDTNKKPILVEMKDGIDPRPVSVSNMVDFMIKNKIDVNFTIFEEPFLENLKDASEYHENIRKSGVKNYSTSVNILGWEKALKSILKESNVVIDCELDDPTSLFDYLESIFNIKTLRHTLAIIAKSQSIS
jgi:hypothetical protein